MSKNSISNKTYLNSLFTEKDFNFINSFDTEISELNSRISYQESIRNKVVQFISSISDVLKLNDPDVDNYSLYKLSDEVTRIFELINTNILLLSTLEKQLNSLDSDIVTLLLDIDKSNNTEEYYEKNIENVKLKIDDYSSLLIENNKKLDVNNIEIDSFLNSENTKRYLNGFNISFKSSCYNINTNKTLKFSDYKINEKDNNVLIISEKDNKVFLPYKIDEINDYLEQFPDQYSSFESVIAKEYILPLKYYMSHPVLSRFREAYSLSRDREAKPVFESLKYGMDMMFNRRLNPAIIAACKTQEQLTNYLNCLDKNDLKKFTDFEIRFEMNPF